MDEEGQYLIQKSLDTYHFLNYATIFWDEHARVIMDNSSIFKKVRRLFRPGPNDTFKFWKRLRFDLKRQLDNGIKFTIMFRKSYETVQNTTPLHWAAILALPLVCELLQNQLDVNKPSYFGSPLHCALLQETDVDMDYEWPTSYHKKHIWREHDRKTVIRILVKRGSLIDMVSPYSEKTPLAISLRCRLCSITDPLVDLGAKLTFDELQEIIVAEGDYPRSWKGLTTAHKLANLIISDEEHGLEETIFRLGVILTIPWVKNELPDTWDRFETVEISYDTTTVPECLDIEYNGPISESTLQVLRRTIESQAQLRSPDTLLALVDYLRKVETSPQELASALFRAVHQYVNVFGQQNQIQTSAMLTILDISEGLGEFFWSDNRGESLMKDALRNDKPRQIIDKLIKFVVDPGYANKYGENLIHWAARLRDSTVLETFFETRDCTSALGKITTTGYCALTCAVLHGLGSNVKILLKEYEAADLRTIRLIVQNALQQKRDSVLEVMRRSKVLSDYLRAEQSE